MLGDVLPDSPRGLEYRDAKWELPEWEQKDGVVPLVRGWVWATQESNLGFFGHVSMSGDMGHNEVY